MAGAKRSAGFISAFTFICAGIVVTPLALVIVHLAVHMGFSALTWNFFTQLPVGPGPGAAQGGMANAIVGTLKLLGIACLIGVPTGVLGGVFSFGIRFSVGQLVHPVPVRYPQWCSVDHRGAL